MQNNTLGKNAILNGIKTLCSIIFPFISFVYSSRILGSDKLGAYSFGQSIVAYLLLISNLGIPNYAIREGAALKNNREKMKVFINQIFTINCVTTIISYIILFILLILNSKINGYKYIILIQSIQIILTTLGTDWINTIYEDYFYLAIRYIGIQIISLIFLVLFVRDSNDIYIYTFISMLSNCGGNILNWKYLRKKGLSPRLTQKVDFKKHVKPIIILFCNSIASVIYLNSDITMLGAYTNNSIVGIYTVSSKIYSMMKTLINAIIIVTLPRFSYYIANQNIKEYKKNLKVIFEILILITVPIVAVLIAEADKILMFVSGSEYLLGVNVVKILSVSLIFATGACFFSYSILIPNKKEKYFLISTIMAAILNIGLNFIFLPKYGMDVAAITTLISEFVVFTISFIFSFKCIRFSINKLDILKIFSSSVIIYLFCKWLDYYIVLNNNLTLIIESIACILVYGIILLMLRCKIFIYLLGKIKGNFIK